MILRSMHVDLLVVMAIGIRFSSIHNNYYHYQQNMTPENYKIKVLRRTEGKTRFLRSIRRLAALTGMKRVWDRRWGWQLAASSAYIQLFTPGTNENL